MLPATLNWEAKTTSDNPEEQVADTIEMMAAYVRADANSPQVQQEAASVAAPDATPQEIIDGVFWHVKRLIRFQEDGTTARPLQSHLANAGLGDYNVVEVLIRPRDMVTWRSDTGKGQVGDCDDFAMLTAALLKARGIEAKFVTVAADPSMPGQFSHVYVAAYPPSGRVALDTSHGEYPGWETAAYSRKEEWGIDAGLRGWLVAGLIVLALWAGRVGKGGKGRGRRRSP